MESVTRPAPSRTRNTGIQMEAKQKGAIMALPTANTLICAFVWRNAPEDYRRSAEASASSG
jgi:hypothetical protein